VQSRKKNFEHLLEFCEPMNVTLPPFEAPGGYLVQDYQDANLPLIAEADVYSFGMVLLYLRGGGPRMPRQATWSRFGFLLGCTVA